VNPKAIICCRDLTKSFGQHQVLRGLDLDIIKGETLVVLGESGSGKSVLLKHINALIRPDSGSVLFDGRDISRLSEVRLTPVRMRIGMLFQGGALFDSLSVADNVGFALDQHALASGEDRESRVKELLDAVGLAGTGLKMPSELSGGMRKRAALARSLAINPEVMLYDEPTTGLDPVTAAQINELIRQTQHSYGLTSVVVTHDIASAGFVADRAAFLYNGKIAEIGSMADLAASSNKEVSDFLRLSRVDISNYK